MKAGRRETAEFPFFEYEGDPTLVVKFAGESNKVYFNQVLKKMEEWNRRKRKLDAKYLSDMRDLDRELFPQYVVVGWKNVTDPSGKEIPFTQENCADYLKNVLDDDQFESLRSYAKDASNFREFVDGGSTAGNSPSA